MNRSEMRLFACVLCLFLLSGAIPLFGQQRRVVRKNVNQQQQSGQSHWLQVEVGAASSELDGEFVLDEGKGDSNVDLDGNLQLDDDLSGRARVQLQVAEGSQFRLGYYGIEYEETAQLNSSITVDGNTYNASDRVKSRVQLDTYEIGFVQNLTSSESFSLDGLFQVNVVDFEAELDNETSGQSVDKSQRVPIPYPGLRIEVNSTDWLGFFGEARYVTGSYDDTDYTSSDLEAGVKFNLKSGYDIRVGYRRFNYDVEVDESELDLTTEGPYASFTFRF